jgi:hypothetical protein
MATLTESSSWETGIYQIEVTDPVSGGVTGIANVQPGQLANRTKYLKDSIAATNASLSASQGAITTLQGNIVTNTADHGTINTAIANIQNNRTMQGIEGELFFFTLAF